MAIPDYADERSYDYFERGFFGRGHGDDGSSYHTSWDSRCDAEPTKMITTAFRPICAYCGNMGLPLQPYIGSHNDYTTTGYTCVCKDAMDEQEWRHEVTEMENNHAEELQALRKREPKANPDVIKTLVSKLTQKMLEAKDLHDVNYVLRQIKDISEE